MKLVLCTILKFWFGIKVYFPQEISAKCAYKRYVSIQWMGPNNSNYRALSACDLRAGNCPWKFSPSQFSQYPLANYNRSALYPNSHNSYWDNWKPQKKVPKTTSQTIEFVTVPGSNCLGDTAVCDGNCPMRSQTANLSAWYSIYYNLMLEYWGNLNEKLPNHFEKSTALLQCILTVGQTST